MDTGFTRHRTKKQQYKDSIFKPDISNQYPLSLKPHLSPLL